MLFPQNLTPSSMNLLLLKTALCQLIKDKHKSVKNKIGFKEDCNSLNGASQGHKRQTSKEHAPDSDECVLGSGCCHVEDFSHFHEVSTGQFKCTLGQSECLSEQSKCTSNQSKCTSNQSSCTSDQSRCTSDESFQYLFTERFKGNAVISVVSPFQFQSITSLPHKRKMDALQESSCKKIKVESASCSESFQSCGDLIDDEPQAETSISKIFSLTACSFDSYLDFLNNLCKQIQCRCCYGNIGTNVKEKDESKPQAVSDSPGAPVATDVEAAFKSRVCSEICASPRHDNRAGQCRSVSSNLVESLSSTSNEASVMFDKASDGLFSQLSSAEVAEALLACVLHPDVIETVSRMFEQRCEFQLRHKSVMK